MEKTNNSRWWETYFVRYITGSVVGAVIVYEILAATDKTIPSWHDLKSETLMALGLMGFAYCYLASAPITFLHAIRVGGDGTSHASTLLPMMLIVSGPVLIMLLTNPGANNADLAPVILFIVFAFCWLLFQVYVIEHRGWSKAYDDLVSARNDKLRRSGEFVESYRHLREHGNAFYIVLLEILLAMPLYVFAKYGNWLLFILMFLIWLLPGIVCWYMGNNLERFMFQQYLEKNGRKSFRDTEGKAEP